MSENNMPPQEWLVRPNGEIRPIPDPTTLTTKQLNTAIAALRTLLETRISNIDVAFERLQEEIDRVPEIIAKELHTMEKRQDDRFSDVKSRFEERDTRFELLSQANRERIDSAMASSKESVDAQTRSITKQLDQINAVIGSLSKAMDDKINDLKERIVLVDARSTTTSTSLDARQKTQADIWGFVVGAAGVAFSIGSVIHMLLH